MSFFAEDHSEADVLPTAADYAAAESDYWAWVRSWEAKGWSWQQCSRCQGTGFVAVYSAYDFEGAGECDRCKATGVYWITPKGRYVLYPGGPFVGG